MARDSPLRSATSTASRRSRRRAGEPCPPVNWPATATAAASDRGACARRWSRSPWHLLRHAVLAHGPLPRIPRRSWRSRGGRRKLASARGCRGHHRDGLTRSGIGGSGLLGGPNRQLSPRRRRSAAGSRRVVEMGPDDKATRHRRRRTAPTSDGVGARRALRRRGARAHDFYPDGLPVVHTGQFPSGAIGSQLTASVRRSTWSIRPSVAGSQRPVRKFTASLARSEPMSPHAGPKVAAGEGCARRQPESSSNSGWWRRTSVSWHS
jgi:hypothetical protein